MKFLGLEKKEGGRFINRYDLHYETASGKEKTYEIISRNRNLQKLEDLHNKQPEAVVIIMLDESGERILLNREFRMAVGEPVYNFPAGLIDPGEDVMQAARRELWEETGLTLLEIKDVLPKSYSAVGFSEESNMCVVGVAGGSFSPSTSDEEEIEAGWYTKAEIRDLLSKYPFAARSQAWCYCWSHS